MVYLIFLHNVDTGFYVEYCCEWWVCVGIWVGGFSSYFIGVHKFEMRSVTVVAWAF